MFSHDKLIGKIIEKYKSRTAIANELSISQNALSRKLQGKAHFKDVEIYKIVSLLGISLSEISEYFFTTKV